MLSNLFSVFFLFITMIILARASQLAKSKDNKQTHLYNEIYRPINWWESDRNSINPRTGSSYVDIDLGISQRYKRNSKFAKYLANPVADGCVKTDTGIDKRVIGVKPKRRD